MECFHLVLLLELDKWSLEGSTLLLRREMLAIHFLKQHECNPPLEIHIFPHDENLRAIVQLNSTGFSEATQYSRICFTMSNVIAVIKTIIPFDLCNLGLIFKFSFKVCVYMPFLAPKLCP